MLKRLTMLGILLAWALGSPLMAAEADTADKSTESGQQQADTKSTGSGNNDKESDEESEEEPDCD